MPASAAAWSFFSFRRRFHSGCCCDCCCDCCSSSFFSSSLLFFVVSSSSSVDPPSLSSTSSSLLLLLRCGRRPLLLLLLLPPPNPPPRRFFIENSFSTASRAISFVVRLELAAEFLDKNARKSLLFILRGDDGNGNDTRPLAPRVEETTHFCGKQSPWGKRPRYLLLSKVEWNDTTTQRYWLVGWIRLGQ